MHATAFLSQPPEKIPGVIALTGSLRHFKLKVLQQLRTAVTGNDDTSLTTFAGKTTDLKDVVAELRTVSMWGDRRLVVVDDADDFVTRFRSPLEKYVEQPARKSVLVLDVTSWPKTTRLAKQVASSGLEIDGSPLKGAELQRWLHATATDIYDARLERDAAALLLELIGEEPGLLETELAKLSSYVGSKGKITADVVRSLVGGWRTETTWFMTDALRDQRTGEALGALDDLLRDGEAPAKLLGGIGFVFRKLALATELANSRSLEQALRDAGVFPRDVAACTAYLRRLGRTKAERILTHLVTADAGLRGMSRLPERILVERLLLQLAGLG